MSTAPHGLAAEIARVVREYFDPNTGPGPDDGETVIRVSSTDDDIVEVIYRRPEVDFTIGLRIRVFPDKDDEATRVVTGNIQEPLGTFMDTIEFDADGIGWWAGEPPEWWYAWDD